VYYLEAPATAGGPYTDDTKLHKYDLKNRKDEVILPKVNRYQISYDKKMILYASGATWDIVPVSGKKEEGKGKLNIKSIEVRIDPINEWNQIFDEAWRINRDYFYATNMHGVDWNAMKEKYSVFCLICHAGTILTV